MPFTACQVDFTFTVKSLQSQRSFHNFLRESTFRVSREKLQRLAARPRYRTPGRVLPGPVPRCSLSPRVRGPPRGGSKWRAGSGGCLRVAEVEVDFAGKQSCRSGPQGIGEGMWGSGRSAGPPVLEHEGEEGLTLLRSSSCCCSNSGTAAMATRASSGGLLAVRGKKRLGRRRRLRGASQGRPRPRLRQPPCPTAAGGLRTPPPSQQPRERPAARHVLPQSGLPRPRCRPSWSRAKKLRVAYPRSGPRGNGRPQGRDKDSEQRVLSATRVSRNPALLRGAIYYSARVQDGDRL